MRRNLPLLALLAVAAALRLVGLNSELWHDELAMLVELVRQPIGVVLGSFPSDNNHPLYTLLAWLSVGAFGESPWATRLPAALFGIGSIWALYAFGARLTDRREAWLAGALLALSYHHLWFSQNARGYTGLLFFTILSSYWFIRALEDGGWKSSAMHGATLALATYIHLTAVYVFVAQAAICASARWSAPGGVSAAGRRAAGTGLAVAALTSLALHAPILPQMIRALLFRERRVPADVEWTSPVWMLLEATRSLGAGIPIGLTAMGIGAAVCLVGLVSYWRRSRLAVLLFILPGALGAAVSLALGRNLWPRFFFFLVGFGTLVVVRGVLASCSACARLAPSPSRRRIATGLAAAAAAVALAVSALMLPRNYRLPKQDYARARAFVDSVRREGEPVITTGLATFTYAAYYSASFQAVSSVAELDRSLTGKSGAYLIYTFPIHLQARYPELWAEISRRGREVGRFPGTVGGGDIVVLRFER